MIGCTCPWFAGFVLSADPEQQSQEFGGRVVSMAALLKEAGATPDTDVETLLLALVQKDGSIKPILKDAGSRMFFKDRQLLDRPVILRGRLVGRTPYLQVFQVFTIVQGRRHEPFYWCDICKIKRFEPNACDCCGAPLEFREEPVDR
jgi:hypothetical protein